MSAKPSFANLTGMVLSIGCVIHCMLMPLCIAKLPEWGLTWLASSGLHQVLAVVGVLIGLWTLVPGWKIHRRSRVMVSAIAGLSIMNYTAFAGENCCEIPADGSPVVACESCDECDACEEATEPTTAVASLATANAAVAPGLVENIWQFLWNHPTVFGATLLGLAHFMNGSCTRGCCGSDTGPVDD